MKTTQAPEWATHSVPFDDGRLYYGPVFGVLETNQGHAADGSPTEPIIVSTGDTQAFDDPAELLQLAADATAAAAWLEEVQR